MFKNFKYLNQCIIFLSNNNPNFQWRESRKLNDMDCNGWSVPALCKIPKGKNQGRTEA